MNKETGIPQEIQQKIIRIIKALIPETRIYLYGSRARGDFHPRSDIDIALDAGKKLERIEVGEVRDVLEATNMIYHFDVIDLNNIPDDLRKNIIRDAILWKD
jgi:predicted nucleotidyltransferase